jgi:hypothetical protein
MKFRKLRIAWSVGCAIACVLLIVLWVRSYMTIDTLGVPPNVSRVSKVRSSWGLLHILCFDDPAQGRNWTIESVPLTSDRKQFVKDATQKLTKFGFAHYSAGSNENFLFPYWLPFIGIVLLAAAPWIHRFSLRTLLIATTLIAVVLGLVVWASR